MKRRQPRIWKAEPIRSGAKSGDMEESEKLSRTPRRRMFLFPNFKSHSAVSAQRSLESLD